MINETMRITQNTLCTAYHIHSCSGYGYRRVPDFTVAAQRLNFTALPQLDTFMAMQNYLLFCSPSIMVIYLRNRKNKYENHTGVLHVYKNVLTITYGEILHFSLYFVKINSLVGAMVLLESKQLLYHHLSSLYTEQQRIINQKAGLNIALLCYPAIHLQVKLSAALPDEPRS